MVTLYVKKIDTMRKQKHLTIEEVRIEVEKVPLKWRAEVAEKLGVSLATPTDL